ncbi:MAG: single-stranded DNA-binding protein [Planctomycetaceae bacterium]
MASHNRVILLGNLTRDIELRHTPGGTAVTDMGIAVNDKRKNANGEWVDEVTYVEITLWGRTAEVANEYLHKGSQVFVEGRLKLDSWEAEGQKKYKLKVIGEKIQFLGSRSDDSDRGSSGSSRSNSGYAGNRQAASSNDYYESENVAHGDEMPRGRRDAQPTGNGPGYQDDDIPF